jgi:hypothetical protein
LSSTRITLWKKNEARSTAGILFLLAILFMLAAFLYAFTGGWLGGSSDEGEFLGRMNVQVLDCTYDADKNWVLLIAYENVDHVSAKIARVYVNSNEVMYYGIGAPESASKVITTDLKKGMSVSGGGSGVFTVWIGRDYGFLSVGNLVYVKVECLGEYSAIASARLV